MTRWLTGLTEITAAFDTAGLDDLSPAAALVRLLELIRRGQENGDFNANLALGRAAEQEVKAGRMTIEEATTVVHRSFLRLVGVTDSPQG